MDNLEERIAAMLAESRETRYDFLQTEINVCWTMADTVRTRAAEGNWGAATEELREAEKGYETVVRFLPDLNEVQRPEVEKRWAELRIELDELQRLIKEKDAGLGMPAAM